MTVITAWRSRWTIGLTSAVALVLSVLAAQTLYKPPIKIGVMHSLTGTMASSERSMVDAIQLAVEEINHEGGLLGRQILPLVVDGQSDPEHFRSAAEKLIHSEGVDVVFGCWTSGCRKTVAPVFEANNHLLYYALQYEGLENSPNIIYLGATPNQQAIPALQWAFSEIGDRIFLLGSDYIYPRATHQVVKDVVGKWRGTIVGEVYVPLGHNDFSAVVEEISQAQPDVIINTINGDSNLDFFRTLRAAGITATDVPTIAFSLSENELDAYKDIDMNGDLLVWNYLSSQENPLNQKFVEQFEKKYGADRRAGSPMLMAYMSVKLWAKAVERAGSSNVNRVRKHATDLSVSAPSGMLYIDAENLHTWKPMRIGRIGPENKVETLWHSEIPIRPIPFFESRTQDQWLTYLNGLHQSWDGQWQAPRDTEKLQH